MKEVPLWSRETRKSIKEWISVWQHNLNDQAHFVTVYGTFWNVPEGCVSVLQDHCYCGSLLVPLFFEEASICVLSFLQNLIESVGAVPENALREVTVQLVQGMKYLHTKVN